MYLFLLWEGTRWDVPFMLKKQRSPRYLLVKVGFLWVRQELLRPGYT